MNPHVMLGLDRDLRVAEVYGVPVKYTGIPNRVLAKFAQKIAFDESGCWIWSGYERSSGYGGIGHGGKLFSSHRFSYMVFSGELPEGKHIHHVCEVRRCVNPGHLQAVDPVEHALELTPHSITSRNWRATHCIRGHELSGDNLYIDEANGKRRCRECKRLWAVESRAEYREAHPKLRRTTCKNGHPWIPENLSINSVNGRNFCKICRAEYMRQYHIKDSRHDRDATGRKTRCHRGHEYTPDNTYTDPRGHRSCKACININYHRRKEKHLA